ncbi:MAG: GWxTD domain-containing protein [bacterium]
MKRTILLSLLGLVVLAWTSAAQRRESLTLYAGVTQYPNPEFDTVVMLDFPFSLNQSEFEFFKADSSSDVMEARAYVRVELIGSGGIAVDSSATYFTLRAIDTTQAALRGLRVFDRLSLFARPGTYSARLIAIDVAGKKQGEVFIGQIHVQSGSEGLGLSQLQPAYRIRKVEDQSVNQRLVRNGLEVIPNPMSIFDDADSVARFYGEGYNLQALRSAEEYLMSLEILGADSLPIHMLGSRLVARPGNSCVIAERIDISGLAVGLYFFKVTIGDVGGPAAASRLAPFRIVSPQELLAASRRQQETFDPYDTLSLDMKTRLVAYMLSPAQRASLDKLTDRGKLSYLEQYWAEQDPDPSTMVNESRIDIMRRFEFANREFSTNAEKSDGWWTDRGRIYLTRGKYDRIDDREAPLLEEAFQIWYYDELKQGRYYIFQDREGDDDYRLVHSNDPAEVFSRDWEDRINQGEIELAR